MGLRELLKAFRDAHRRDVPALLGVAGLFVVLFLLVAYVVILLLSKFPWHRAASAIDNHGNVAIATLTFVLVVISAFYAAVTYRMLVQMQESRAAGIKPL